MKFVRYIFLIFFLTKILYSSKIYGAQSFSEICLFPIFGQKGTLTKFPIYEHSFLLVMAQNFLDDSVCRIFQT